MNLMSFLYLVSIILIVFILESHIAGNSLVIGKLGSFGLNGLDDTSNNTKAIGICCSWNKNLTTGNLSYSIINVNKSFKQAIEEGLKEWSKTDTIRFVEVPDSDAADIRIRYIPKESANSLQNVSNNGMITQGGLMVGKTIDTFDNNGYIARANVVIYGSAFGDLLDFQTLRNVAAHEIGHALGLGHASFNSDLMFNKVSYDKEFVSQCDINGVLKTNEWKVSYSVSDSNRPTPHTFTC
jgi:predicted Zn-dependent protease